jgi:hypothetical protein
MKNAYNILIGKHQGERAFLVLGVDGRIILEHVLDNCVKVELDLADSRVLLRTQFQDP